MAGLFGFLVVFFGNILHQNCDVLLLSGAIVHLSINFKLMNPEIPLINNQFVCIIDRNRPDLAAIIASYLFRKGCYLPIFEFLSVTAANENLDEDVIDENSITRDRATKFATFTNNVLARMGSCEYLILAGLSDEQKSYLDFINLTTAIQIDEISEIDFLLSPFLLEEKQIIKCRSSELLEGLFLSQRQNNVIQIDEAAASITIELRYGRGVVIVENDESVASVIAVNWASSIDSDLLVVNSLEEDEKFIIQNHLEDWQNGDLSSYSEIEKMVLERVGVITFTKFLFGTFFTTGLPYSLVLKNCIPFSYVNLHLKPDFFIINNLIYEGKNQFGSAVVFSPKFFKDEETDFVSNGFKNRGFFVKELLGKAASVYNLDMHLKEFPYDLFHLCSHGGEIEGTTIEEFFFDRDGNRHTVEYDSVLSISASPRKEYLNVQHKSYFKKFDGLKWRSSELKNKHYPHYVFVDMQNALRSSTSKQKKAIGGRKKIPNSCGIQCIDSNHQGMVTTIASHSSPIIFNNTCWSWYQIAETFLVNGARGYIGTLWAVENAAAVDFAKEFYKNNLNTPIITSFHQSLNVLNGGRSENIYIFWGLHFSTLNIADKIESRKNVFSHLLKSYYQWKDRLSIIRNKRTAELIADIVNWTLNELKETFTKNDFELLKDKFNKSRKKS
jgi:hypothetical protein